MSGSVRRSVVKRWPLIMAPTKRKGPVTRFGGGLDCEDRVRWKLNRFPYRENRHDPRVPSAFVRFSFRKMYVEKFGRQPTAFHKTLDNHIRDLTNKRLSLLGLRLLHVVGQPAGLQSCKECGNRFPGPRQLEEQFEEGSYGFPFGAIEDSWPEGTIILTEGDGQHSMIWHGAYDPIEQLPDGFIPCSAAMEAF